MVKILHCVQDDGEVKMLHCVQDDGEVKMLHCAWYNITFCHSQGAKRTKNL